MAVKIGDKLEYEIFRSSMDIKQCFEVYSIVLLIDKYVPYFMNLRFRPPM